MKIEKNNSKKSYLKKTIFIFIVFMLLFSFTPRKTKAAWIPGLDPAILISLQEIKTTMVSIIVEALKTVAISTINQQINQIVGGEEGFITNWKSYIVVGPKNRAFSYFNDYVSKATRGRCSGSSYSAEGYNYSAALCRGAINRVGESVSVSVNNYEGNPRDMFRNGRLKNLDNYLSGVNNPWSFNTAARNAYEKKVEEEKELVKTQSIAYQGFKGTTKGETVTRPGSLTKDLIADTESMPNDLMVRAKSIPEFTAALVSNIIAAAVRRGFQSIVSTANTEIENATNYENAISGISPGNR